MFVIDKKNTKYAIARAVIVSFFIMLPAVIWISYDTSPFGGDQSWYAKASIELYKAWSVSPKVWVREMIRVLEFKAPGIVWIGQFFVPIGLFFGSIDSALMFSILIILALALSLIYLSIHTLSDGQTLTALIGCYFIALSPLFLGLFCQYLTEPMQLLSTAWFIFILSRSLQWAPSLILTQLLSASFFAILAKASTPIYCVIIGGFLIFYIFRVKQRNCPWVWMQRSTLLTIFFSIPLIVLTLLWYVKNINSVIMHISNASVGSVAAVWGKVDSYWGTLIYWLDASGKWLFFPLTLIIGSAFVATGFLKKLIKKDSVQKHFSLCAVFSVIQIFVVLLFFSKSDNREPRYLFALLAYIAVVVAWGISQFHKSYIVLLAAIIIIGNWLIGWGYGLGKIGISTSISDRIKPLDRCGNDAKILNQIVMRTCNESSQHKYLNIIAIDPLLKGDWLAPVPADYEAIKLQLFSKINGSCHFGYIGDNFFGASAKKAWESITSLRPTFVIIPNPETYPPLGKVINLALNKENFPEIFSKISFGGKFIKEEPLKEDKNIFIFKYFDIVAEGRRLSDNGEHIKAIELLENGLKNEINNPEFWANLQLAYLRFGKYEKAKGAGLRTLDLSPRHYWALKNLTLCHYALHEWHEAIVVGNKALISVPDDIERASILSILADAHGKIKAN